MFAFPRLRATTVATTLAFLPAKIANFGAADSVHRFPGVLKVLHRVFHPAAIGPDFFCVPQGFRIPSPAVFIPLGVHRSGFDSARHDLNDEGP